jgi:hypothetical protein
MTRNALALEQLSDTPDRSLGGLLRSRQLFVAEYQSILMAMKNDVCERPPDVDREGE